MIFMSRGPGGKRRFDKTDFVLANAYVQGAIPGTMTYEQRQQEAQYKASMLRKTGMNARIVNGSGWTAVYVGIPTFGQPLPNLIIKPQKELVKTEIPKFTPIKVFKEPTLNIGSKFGIEPIKAPPKIDVKKNSQIKGMSQMMWKEDKYFENNGMGRFFPLFEIKDNSKVTDWKSLDVTKPEGSDVINSMTKMQGMDSFRDWITAAGRNNETEWKTSPALRDIGKVFTGPADLDKDGLNIKAKEIFVIYVDERPAYWSPADSKYAKSIKKMLDETVKPTASPPPDRNISGDSARFLTNMKWKPVGGIE